MPAVNTGRRDEKTTRTSPLLRNFRNYCDFSNVPRSAESAKLGGGDEYKRWSKNGATTVDLGFIASYNSRLRPTDTRASTGLRVYFDYCIICLTDHGILRSTIQSYNVRSQ